MAVINNISTLNSEEEKSLSKLCVEHIRKEASSKNKSASFPCRIQEYLRIKKYVKELLSNIRSGKMIGYVSFDFDFKNDTVIEKASGFIIGYNKPANQTNHISHVFVGETESYPRLTVLKDLFSSYANSVKDLGASKVEVSRDTFDVRLLEDLETLEFAQIEDRDFIVDYGRRI